MLAVDQIANHRINADPRRTGDSPIPRLTFLHSLQFYIDYSHRVVVLFDFAIATYHWRASQVLCTCFDPCHYAEDPRLFLQVLEPR
jgi:hypothetical protein